MIRRRGRTATSLAWLGICAAALASACGSGLAPASSDYAWLEGKQAAPPAGTALRVRWRERLTPVFEGAFLPVERAVPALDPRHDRVYAGSSAGDLLALTASGGAVYRYRADAAIGSAPALDAQADELYVGSEGGKLHAIEARDGSLRWEADAAGPIGNAPVLGPDTVYVVTDTDRVVAFAREDGTLLWSYRREPPGGFSVAGHAGLALEGGLLITGFSDGAVVALDPTDGRVAWERDTSLDVPEPESAAPTLIDVDATPRVVGDVVYVASFAGGLYALAHANGSVLWRQPDLTGILGLAPVRGGLIVASADHGVYRLALPDREIEWRHRLRRGAPSHPVVAGNLVLVSESSGSMLALSLGSGRELARLDAGHGFAAPPSVADGRGFIVSNGGSLLAFVLGR